MSRMKLQVAVLGIVGLVAASAQAVVVIYEPFDYQAGGLNGQGGAELGLTGTWNANSTTQVVGGSLAYGTLPTQGGSIGIPAGGVNRFGGARSIDASALAGNGLLANGAELWFSLEMGYNGGNATNTTLAFALANNQFTGGNYSYQIADDGGTLGSGLGVFMGRRGVTNGHVFAAQFQDPSFGTGFSGNVYGTDLAGNFLGNPDHTLVVGKITWGAANDTIDLYIPDVALNLGSVVSSLTVNVDQSAFDMITFERGDGVAMDEIRFGMSYEDVIGVIPPVPVPEPATRMLAALGLLGMGWRRRKRA